MKDRDQLAERLRGVAFATAYRMLGDRTAAEDIAQDSVERWLTLHNIASDEAIIATIAARLSLNDRRNHRRRLRKRDELPVPLTSADPADGVFAADLAYGLTMLVTQLSPVARAVYVLRTGFDLSFDQIGAALDRTAVACRQAYRRAQRALEAAAPPVQLNVAVQRRALTDLMSAIRAGDAVAVERLLAAEIVLHTDGGAGGPDISRPLRGVRAVAQLLAKSPRLAPDARNASIVVAPQGAQLRLSSASGLAMVVMVDVSALGIAAIYVLSDPEKLAQLAVH